MLRRSPVVLWGLLLTLASPTLAVQVVVLDQPTPYRTELRVTEDDPWASWPVKATDAKVVNALRNLAQVFPNPLADVPVRCVPQQGEAVQTRTDGEGRAHCSFPAAPGPVRVEVPQGKPLIAEPLDLGQAAHLTVSDLDDTLIVTGVTQGGLRRLLTSNALTRPVFPDAPGLLHAQAARGPVVYLSNSPDGLQASLRQLLSAQGFPAGPLWLRPFPRVSGPQHKTQALERLAQQSRARLTLIGDSGELDPEIYAAFVRAWSGRVERILIRDVGTKGRHAEVERLLGGLGVAWGWLPGSGLPGSGAEVSHP